MRHPKKLRKKWLVPKLIVLINSDSKQEIVLSFCKTYMMEGGVSGSAYWHPSCHKNMGGSSGIPVCGNFCNTLTMTS